MLFRLGPTFFQLMASSLHSTIRESCPRHPLSPSSVPYPFSPPESSSPSSSLRGENRAPHYLDPSSAAEATGKFPARVLKDFFLLFRDPTGARDLVHLFLLLFRPKNHAVALPSSSSSSFRPLSGKESSFWKEHLLREGGGVWDASPPLRVLCGRENIYADFTGGGGLS